MKLYAPFEKYANKIGGPQTFMFNLHNFLKGKGVGLTEDPYQSNVILFPIIFDRNILTDLKKKNVKVIQRLDGIYYPSKHKPEEVEFNEGVKDVYLNFADFIIFQSEYSRQQCFKMLGEVNRDKYEIIVNGVDSSIFYPNKSGSNKLGEKIKFVTSSHFRNIDMIEPIIKALDELKLDKEFELHVIGPIVNPKINELIDRKYVIHHGEKDLYGVSEILRECDIYLYSHLNPPCPNAVVEAVSTGLPVVSFSSGAMPELCSFSKDLLAEVSQDIFQKYEDFDYKKLIEKIKLAVENFETYKQKSVDNAGNYSFKECGEKYLEVAERMYKEYELSYYNDRYSQEEYRFELNGYEIARVNALKHLVQKVIKLNEPLKVLDYGGGNGLHAKVWKDIFNKPDLYFCDISETALKQLVDNNPEYKEKVRQITNDKVEFEDNSFDVVMSVEVMEHVSDLRAYLTEVKRILKPGGTFIWTTPCGNELSIEHIYNVITNNIEATPEGYRRWKWEDPSHVRRLKTREISKIITNEVGFSKVDFKLRSHFFSFVCTALIRRKLISEKLGTKLMDLDYKLFRNLPNGASMIGYAKK